MFSEAGKLSTCNNRKKCGTKNIFLIVTVNSFQNPKYRIICKELRKTQREVQQDKQKTMEGRKQRKKKWQQSRIKKNSKIRIIKILQ